MIGNLLFKIKSIIIAIFLAITIYLLYQCIFYPVIPVMTVCEWVDLPNGGVMILGKTIPLFISPYNVIDYILICLNTIINQSYVIVIPWFTMYICLIINYMFIEWREW